MGSADSGHEPSGAGLRGIPGVPESRLTAADAARLPSTTPSPPWDTNVDAVLWTHRATAAAGAALPRGVRARRVARFAVAGFVRYHATPVGSYDELLASPTLVRGGLWRLHVPLIAVDSLTSLHAGRAHWALPKSLAEFSAAPAGRCSLEARGVGWSVRVAVVTRGPAVPAVLRVSLAQVRAAGDVITIPVTCRGPAQIARVAVTLGDAPSFADWLRPGRHLGVLLRGVRLRLGSPS